MNDIRIQREPLNSRLALALITELNAELSARYPEEGANHFRLDASEVGAGRGAFFVAYAGQEAVGCGAIRCLDHARAEIKRMYVKDSARGRGVGSTMLQALQDEARRLGVRELVLETGSRQHEAVALYKKAGFAPIPPFGEYIDSPLSYCMAKPIKVE